MVEDASRARSVEEATFVSMDGNAVSGGSGGSGICQHGGVWRRQHLSARCMRLICQHRQIATECDLSVASIRRIQQRTVPCLVQQVILGPCIDQRHCDLDLRVALFRRSHHDQRCQAPVILHIQLHLRVASPSRNHQRSVAFIHLSRTSQQVIPERPCRTIQRSPSRNTSAVSLSSTQEASDIWLSTSLTSGSPAQVPHQDMPSRCSLQSAHRSASRSSSLLIASRSSEQVTATMFHWRGCTGSCCTTDWSRCWSRPRRSSSVGVAVIH